MDSELMIRERKKEKKGKNKDIKDLFTVYIMEE